MDKYPSWVLELKPPGTEVKYINGRYYLYTASSSVRGEDGKPHKISGEYLGVLVKDVGLIKKGERDSKLQGKVRPKYSYGIAGTLTPLMGVELSRLRFLFQDDWQTIIAFALCRLSSGCPIYEMNKLWDQNFLSHFLTSVSFSEGDIKKALKRIGSAHSAIEGYMNGIPHEKDTIVFRGPEGFPEWDGTILPHLQGNASDSSEAIHGLMMAHSVSGNTPIRCLPVHGYESPIESILSFSKTADLPGSIIIDEVASLGEEGMKELDLMNRNYILRLDRNSKLIDYSLTAGDPPYKGESFFQYRGKPIFGVRQYLDRDHDIYLFVDLFLREEESRRMRVEIIKKTGKPSKESDRIRLWEDYRTSCSQFGTIAFIVPSKMEERLQENTPKTLSSALKSRFQRTVTPEFVYLRYMEMETIREKLSQMKTLLHEDSRFIEDHDSLQGWMFCNFVAQQWYCRLQNKIITSPSFADQTCKEIISSLSGVQATISSRKWSLFSYCKGWENLSKVIGISQIPEFVFPTNEANPS